MAEDLYVLGSRGDGDASDAWVSPRPIDEAIVESVTEATDLAADDLAEIEEYVDTDEVAAVLDGDGDDSVTFEVEGYEIEVDPSGQLQVTES